MRRAGWGRRSRSWQGGGVQRRRTPLAAPPRPCLILAARLMPSLPRGPALPPENPPPYARGSRRWPGRGTSLRCGRDREGRRGADGVSRGAAEAPADAGDGSARAARQPGRCGGGGGRCCGERGTGAGRRARGFLEDAGLGVPRTRQRKLLCWSPSTPLGAEISMSQNAPHGHVPQKAEKH